MRRKSPGSFGFRDFFFDFGLRNFAESNFRLIFAVPKRTSPACAKRHPTTGSAPAEIAQLVEHNLAKVGVASSSLVFRSKTGGLRNQSSFLLSVGELRHSRPSARQRSAARSAPTLLPQSSFLNARPTRRKRSARPRPSEPAPEAMSPQSAATSLPNGPNLPRSCIFFGISAYFCPV